jgi:hypothetical protein
MSTAAEVFTKHFTDIQDEIRRVRRGRTLNEVTSGAGRDAWNRLDLRTRVGIQIAANAIEKHPDPVVYISKEMQDFFTSHSAAEILTPDALHVLKVYLGESVDEE